MRLADNILIYFCTFNCIDKTVIEVRQNGSSVQYLQLYMLVMFGINMTLGSKIQIRMSLRQRFLQEEATILQNQTLVLLSSAQLSLESLSSRLVTVEMERGEWTDGGRGLQVIVPNSLESVVAVEIIAADVVCRVGGADPSKGHGAQLG